MRYTAKELGYKEHRDFVLLASIGLLLIIGTAILYSVAPQLFPTQWLYIVLAITAFLVFAHLDRIVLQSTAHMFYVVIISLLVATLLLGVVNKGALRWLSIGPFTLQASEFAKPVLAMMTSMIMVRFERYGFLLSLLAAAIVVGLVFIQPDLGTAMIMGASWLGAVLSFKISTKTFITTVLIGLAFLPLLWVFLQPYQKDRVISFILPHDVQGASYQAAQSVIAMGSGGLLGSGLGQGSQTQLDFLPARHTDFVFASIGEELGFVGAGLVLISFFILFWRILQALVKTDEIFTRGTLSGIWFYLFIQTFVNLGMNLGILPIAGVPLPILSSGGSALVATMMTLGIVIALRR